MNKKLFLLVMFVLSLGLGFTACGDDDEDEKGNSVEYSGTIKIPALLEDKTLPNSIVMTDVSANVVRLALNEIELPAGDASIKIKNITLNKVSKTQSGDVYILSTPTPERIKINFGIELEADVSVEGTIKGDRMELKIEVGEVLGYPDGLNIDFTGNKK